MTLKSKGSLKKRRCLKKSFNWSNQLKKKVKKNIANKKGNI